MNRWRSTVSLGEGLAIVANIGVVVGIVFVWMELRNNQAQLSADVELSLAASYQTALGRTLENDHLADLMMMAYQDPSSLSTRDSIQLMSIHAEWMSIVYATWVLRRDGAVSEESWLMHSNYYLEFLRTTWLQNFWRSMHHEGMYPKEFMQDLESRLPIPESPGIIQDDA